MGPASGQLNLVSFASDLGSGQTCDGLLGALRSLGYRVHLTGGDDWSSTSVRELSTVVYLGSRNYCRERVESVLTSSAPWPRLAVVGREASAWDPRLLQLCNDFVSWPCCDEELTLRLQRAGFGGGNKEPDDELLVEEFSRLRLIGGSAAFLQVLRLIKRMAESDAPVLIQGETGTGKELAARAIHYIGPRRSFPFIPVNCGAIPDGLLENELFGHHRGAFTDASTAQSGLVAEAEGGSLFLDEVEALSSRAQVALLRFLQDQEYRPLGAPCARKANVRVIAATNNDLEKLVGQRLFRQDLFFRLRILVLAVPPLRSRLDDIPLLVEHFLGEYAHRYGQVKRHLSSNALDAVCTASWPGNVRELENAIHRAVLVADGPTIEGWHLIPGADPSGRGHEEAFDGSFSEAKARVIASFEKQYLTWLLAETGGNVTQAAKRAKKERRALGKLLKKHGIQRPSWTDVSSGGP